MKRNNEYKVNQFSLGTANTLLSLAATKFCQGQ